MSEVRTRFAPSPTGFLHLGSARTALFNWAFARHHGGKLLLRIEDTDRERSSSASERAVIDGLQWLGVDWDEGPVRQSERADSHRAAVERLLACGRAYRCTCSAEELEARREATIAAGRKWTYDGRCRDLGLAASAGPHAVRLRLPASGDLDWNDLVFGPSSQDACEIGDRIIQRSDGQPLYHLAVVVDDLEMRISHVIRGADHHPNTPLQIALYRALDAEPPQFAHVPLIVGAGGKKLSKRRDPVSIQDYREAGYLAAALRNWLIRIGWSHADQEIFSSDEIAALFELGAVSRSAAQADGEKLLWLNQHYLKQLPAASLAEALAPFLSAEASRPVCVDAELSALAELQRERGKTLSEMARLSRWFVVDEVDFDDKAVAKHLTPAVESALRELRDGLAKLEAWSRDSIEAVFLAVLARHADMQMGKLAQPVRVAITGGTVSPGIFETLEVLGAPRSVTRINRALERIGVG